MFSAISKTAERLSPLLKRVLIVDPQPASARLLGELVRDICRPEIWAADSGAKAMKLAERIDPQLIFCELSAPSVDGVAFTRALRRSDLHCRKAPLILLTGQATAHQVLAGRDAGAHEFLRRPYAVKDLLRRLDAAMLHPRGWVEAVDYVGPDRRRFNSAEFPGPPKRAADQDAPPITVRAGEALKIIRSALSALERDPRQVERALMAQANELQMAAAELSDARMAAGANQLHRYLVEASGKLDRANLEALTAPLLATAGREAA